MAGSPGRGVAEGGTRIARPRLSGRIAAALEDGSVLLVAGAGFGKTTALEDALAAGGGAVAWVSCTATERAPGRLLVRVIEALRRGLPGAADVLGERVAAAIEQVDPLAGARELVTELERLLVDPLLLVVDDAEQLEARAATELLEELLRADVAGLRLAVASRVALGLRLAKLEAAGRLARFGPADLAFGADECADYLRARHGREPEAHEVEATLTATGGWPLGVALGALSPGGPPAAFDGAAPPRATYRFASRTQVDAFLTEEVLDQLPPDRRDAVVDSSVARRLTPAIVEALGLPEDFVAEVERLGLFLRVVDPERGDRGYHPLFREFLLARLQAERGPERRRRLHALVAPVVAAEGAPLEALEHWLEAERWPEAVAELARVGPALARTGPDTVRGWIARLPDEVRDEAPVRLLEGQLEWSAGSFERAAELLRGAIAGYASFGDPPGEWLARFSLADALFSLGDFGEAEALAEGFDAPQAATAGPLPPATAVYAGLCLASEGRIDESNAIAERVRRHPDADFVAPLDSLRRALVESPAGRGDVVLREVAVGLARLEDDDPFNRAPYLMLTMAYVLWEQGHATAALDWWHRVEERGGRGGVAPFLTATSRVCRALLHAQSGRLAEAEVELAGAGPLPGAGWRDCHREVAEATVAALRGDAAAAVAAGERALDRVERAPILFRYWAGADLVPVLAQVGQPLAARGVLDRTLALVGDRLPGPEGDYLRARLHGLAAWLAHGEGDEAELAASVGRFWAEAGDAASHVVRREWPRLEPVLWTALERELLDANEVVRAIARAWPEGAPLLPFTEHPRAPVRRAALSPAVSSGHPRALVRLRELESDRDPTVAGAARAAAAGLSAIAPPLVFRLLGGFAVRRGAWLVDEAAWGRPMAIRLVRFLLVHRDAVVPEDLLFEAFWPDKPPAAARRGLQVAVSRARTVLDPPAAEESMVEVADRAYRLRIGENDLLDVDEFELAAEAALAAGGTARRPLLERAKRLWGGEPLPEDRYAEWAVAWRERLVDRHIEVLAALAEVYAAGGEHAAAIATAREVVALDPVNEGAHRDLMAAYARAGRTGHALRQYLECRRTLVDELGIEPSEATSRLQARILAGEPV